MSWWSSWATPVLGKKSLGKLTNTHSSVKPLRLRSRTDCWVSLSVSIISMRISSHLCRTSIRITHSGLTTTSCSFGANLENSGTLSGFSWSLRSQVWATSIAGTSCRSLQTRRPSWWKRALWTETSRKFGNFTTTCLKIESYLIF